MGFLGPWLFATCTENVKVSTAIIIVQQSWYIENKIKYMWLHQLAVSIINPSSCKIQSSTSSLIEKRPVDISHVQLGSDRRPGGDVTGAGVKHRPKWRPSLNTDQSLSTDHFTVAQTPNYLPHPVQCLWKPEWPQSQTWSYTKYIVSLWHHAHVTLHSWPEEQNA